MAGDWIPMRCDLPDEEEVIGMASILNVDQDTVAGKLLRLWGWANRTSKDGKVSNITPGWIDKKVGIPGFAGAMITVGWLLFDGDAVYFPNFERWNSKSAKRRLMDSLRKKSVRKMSATCPQNVRPREEKRREKNSKKENTPLTPKGECEALFERFWESFPRKQAKASAFRAWQKLCVDHSLAALIEKAIERQRTWETWVREGGRFIPHPATWLNQRRWEDEEHGSKGGGLFSGLQAFASKEDAP